MQNRWSESEVARFDGADDIEARLAELVYATRLLGCEPALAMHGAGNTSFKCALRDGQAEARPALFVKASGVDLGRVERGDFIALDHRQLLALVDQPGLADEAFVESLAGHVLRPCSRRASIETPMHTALPQVFVFHTHPNAILALCNRTDGDEVVTAALGPEVVVAPYAPIGLALGRGVREALAGAPGSAALVLKHHGLVTWGATARDAYEATIAIVNRAEAYLAGRRVRRMPASSTVSTVERERRYAALAPAIRLAFARHAMAVGVDSVVLDAEVDEKVVGLLDTPEGRELACSSPLTPDCLLRSRKAPLCLAQQSLDDVDGVCERLDKALADYQAEHHAFATRHGADAEFARLGSLPRALVLPGLGVVTVGKDAADARMVRDIMVQGLRVKSVIWESGGDYASMSEDEIFDMEFRMYRQAKPQPAASAPW